MVHPCFGLIAAISVAANMRSDVWHLHPVNIVVPSDHVIEAVFPMHRHFRVAVLIREKESGISIHHPLAFRLFPILDDCLETLCCILCHWQLPCSGICFGGFNHQLHIGSPLELVVDINNLDF